MYVHTPRHPQQPIYVWKPAKCPSCYSRHIPPADWPSAVLSEPTVAPHWPHLPNLQNKIVSTTVCGQACSWHNIIGQKWTNQKKKSSQDSETRFFTVQTKCPDKETEQINVQILSLWTKNASLPQLRIRCTLYLFVVIAPWRSAVHFSMGSLYSKPQLLFWGKVWPKKLSPPQLFLIFLIYIHYSQ